MKKVLAFTLCLALLLTALFVPMTAVAETNLIATDAVSDWDGYLTVADKGQYIRPKVLKDGTVGAAWYVMGDGGHFGISYDGGVTYRNDVTVVENEWSTTEEERAAGTYKYGRLEVQNPNVIEMVDGKLLYTYRFNTFTSQPEGEKAWDTYYSSIRYQISEDGGATWGDPVIIKETIQPDSQKELGSNGYWEPEPYYIGEDLYVYWCDTVTNYDNLGVQNILGAKWNGNGFDESFIAIDGNTNNSREGMCVVTELTDGTYAMVFESTDTDDNPDTHNDCGSWLCQNCDEDGITFVIKMARSTDGVNWNAASAVTIAKPEVAVSEELADKDGALAVCASPYIITLPDGRVAVSYQTSDLYTGDVIPTAVVRRSVVQVMVSDVAVGADTELSTENFKKIEKSPANVGDNQFANAGSLLYNNGKLLAYSYIGTNSVKEDGSVSSTNSQGIKMAYLDVSTKETTDYGSLDNYIVYQKSTAGAAPTASNGKITVAAGDTTNLIAGKGSNYVDYDNPVETAVDGIFDSTNYTEYNTAGATRVSYSEENSTVTFSGSSKAMINNLDLGAFKASSVLKGRASDGYMQSGYILHMDADTLSTAAYNSAGYVVFLRRASSNKDANGNKTGYAQLDLVIRYCDSATTAVYYPSVIITTALDTTKFDYEFGLSVEVDESNIYITVTDETTYAEGDNAVTGEFGTTYKYALDATAEKSTAPIYDSGTFAFVTNGATTFSDFSLSKITYSEIDSRVFEKATNLKAHGAFALLETPATMYGGFSFHVQDAAAVTAGLSGYTVKLLQTSADLLKLEFSVYELNEDKSKCTNKKSYTVDITEAVIGASGTTSSAKIILDVTVIGDTVTATATNSGNSALTHTQEYDLNDYYTYAEYGKGGYGIYKHGTGAITVEDVEFTVLPLDVENIDDTLYTVYTPEESAGIVYEDGKFVSNEAVTKKMILNDTEVSDFSANATLEIGYDGQLKAGIIFRAQNLGNDIDAMEGYSAVLWKNENGTGNFGRVILLVYKWGKNAAGETVYLGEVGRLDDRKTLNAVYPKAEKDILAAVGAHLKINIKVDGDVVRASFDVLDEYNEVAASSDTKSLLLDKEFAAENVNTYYESGAIGLSISTAGAVCDLNITESVMGKEMSVMSDYTVYSNDDNTMTIDSSVNKKMYSITKGRKQAVLKGVPLTNFEASAVLKSNTAGEVYNMGFDFMINEATHSGQAYNTTHATMGYEGYRAVLVRNANTSTNPAGAVLYLFKFTKDDSGYTRSEVAKVGNTDFFADYTTADTTDAEYAEVEVQLDVELVDGNLTAVATMCEYPERTITLTAEGLEGTGSVGWFISDHGSVSYISVNSVVTEGDLNADGNVNSTDLAIMRKAVMGIEQVGLAIGDVSVKDREIDVRDIVKLKKLAANIK